MKEVSEAKAGRNYKYNQDVTMYDPHLSMEFPRKEVAHLKITRSYIYIYIHSGVCRPINHVIR